MRKDFKEFVIEENRHYDLLQSNPQFRLQGRDKKTNKVVVGIIQGNPEDYKPYHHLKFKYFDSWKEAYLQLS